MRLLVSEYTQAVACSEYVESAVILQMHSEEAMAIGAVPIMIPIRAMFIFWKQPGAY
jgi:hypothetical protein